MIKVEITDLQGGTVEVKDLVSVDATNDKFIILQGEESWMYVTWDTVKRIHVIKED